jgi:hypothetical protein
MSNKIGGTQKPPTLNVDPEWKDTAWKAVGKVEEVEMQK